MAGRGLFLLACLFAIALPASARGLDPRSVFARHDPQGRLPNTKIRKLGVVHVRAASYSIYYLDFSNSASLHGLQQIAVIKNGTEFVGAYQCTLGDGEYEGKARWARPSHC